LSKKGSLKNTKINQSFLEDLGESTQSRNSTHARKSPNEKLANSMTVSRIFTAENPSGLINPIFDDEGYNSDDELNSRGELENTPGGNDTETPFDETDYVEYMSEKSTFIQEKGKIKEFRVSFFLQVNT